MPKRTWDKNVTRASQTRTSASKDTTTSRRAGPVQPGKKDNHPQYTSCADRTLASEPRAHSGGKDAILAAVQAGHHTLPSEGGGMVPPSSTPGPTAGHAHQGADRLILQMRKLRAKGRFTPAHGTRQPDGKVYLPFRCVSHLGHRQTWAPVLSDV